jgi:hypothetical protein
MFSPLAIRGVLLRNRKVFQPHLAALGHPDGAPSDGHVAYHKDRARGGVGLIVIESQAVHPTGKMSRKFINAWDPAVIPALRTITEAVHAHGAKIFSQLTHGGHTSLEQQPHISGLSMKRSARSSPICRRRLPNSAWRCTSGWTLPRFAAWPRRASHRGSDRVGAEPTGPRRGRRPTIARAWVAGSAGTAGARVAFRCLFRPSHVGCRRHPRAGLGDRQHGHWEAAGTAEFLTAVAGWRSSQPTRQSARTWRTAPVRCSTDGPPSNEFARVPVRWCRRSRCGAYTWRNCSAPRTPPAGANTCCSLVTRNGSRMSTGSCP